MKIRRLNVARARLAQRSGGLALSAMRKFLTSRAGLSLVELLVALAILAIALVPLLSIFLHALRTSEHANKRVIALQLMRDMQEEARSKAFTEPNPPAGAIYFPVQDGDPLPHGLDANDNYLRTSTDRLRNSRLAFDDVDDYDGWCRGQDCACGGTEPNTGASADGLCVDDSPLEDYEGNKYAGAGYPHYHGFTRRVQVYNIWHTAGGSDPAPMPHDMLIGRDEAREIKRFDFYDLRAEMFPVLSSVNGESARGRTRLKVIHVTVMYRGAGTPDIRVEDSALAVLPLSRQMQGN